MEYFDTDSPTASFIGDNRSVRTKRIIVLMIYMFTLMSVFIHYLTINNPVLNFKGKMGGERYFSTDGGVSWCAGEECR